MLRLHIHPVYSEENLDPNNQIGSMRLLKHQVATYEAFNDPDVDVIFNTAMTGDGKSLAAYLTVKASLLIFQYFSNTSISSLCILQTNLCKISTMLFQATDNAWISIYHVTRRCTATRSAN